mmetsp:Transcript_35539/g.141720  ORF Transcript_35539/g.141720 Transcript_35539/m.141720 type:complete len:111 (+) Transcript_35539:1693-2025(+)
MSLRRCDRRSSMLYSKMFVEFFNCDKTLSASSDSALSRRVSAMFGFQVALQVGQLIVCCIAMRFVANIRFFTRMVSHMLGEIGPLHEILSTTLDWAFVCPLIIMNSLMLY